MNSSSRWAARVVCAVLTVAAASLAGIAASRDQSPDDYPEAKARVNQSFVLREADDSLARYGYQMGKNKNIIPGKLGYEKYKGRRGTVAGIVPLPISSYRNAYLWQLQLETGETVYARWSSVTPTQIDGAVFQTDISEAQRLIGKTVWVNWVRPGKQKGLITPVAGELREISHLEEVFVVGIDTKLYGHGYGTSPLWLRVKKKNGQEALLGFSEKRIYTENPVEAGWDAKTVGSIRAQQIFVGMTDKQLRLAWGDPSRINRTVTQSGVREQWVYGEQYVYVENGRVTAIQTSR